MMGSRSSEAGDAAGLQNRQEVQALSHAMDVSLPRCHLGKKSPQKLDTSAGKHLCPILLQDQISAIMKKIDF